MSTVESVVLCYRRNPQLVGGRHLFSFSLTEQTGRGVRGFALSMLHVEYRGMMLEVSRALRRHPAARVVMQRIDRENLKPVQLGEDIRTLLRDDPVAALRALDPLLACPTEPAATSLIRSGEDTLADAFGEILYLSVREGQVEDPCSGEYRGFAYGPEKGWLIRGSEDKADAWLPVFLGAHDPPHPPGESVDVGSVLVSARWARVSAEVLCGFSNGDFLRPDEFYLPRRWNEQGAWITREALRRRLEQFRKEVSELCHTQKQE